MKKSNRSQMVLFAVIAIAFAAAALWSQRTKSADALDTVVLTIDEGTGYTTRRCDPVKVNGEAATLANPPESALYLKANCTIVFRDGLEQ